MHHTFPSYAQSMSFSQHSTGGIDGVLILPCLLVPLLGLLFFAFWLWMLVDCLTRDFNGNDKIVWALVIVLAGPIGAIIYFFVGRGQGVKRST